jgi:hypothetical protein
VDGDVEQVELNRDQVVCIYLLYLVGATVFTNTITNYVDMAYIRYFRDLEMVIDYLWGLTALDHLYKEHNKGCNYKTSQLAGYFTLFQL